MSWIMDPIGPEHQELFALDLKNCYISLCLLSSIYKYQSALNLVKIYMTIRSRMSLILGLIRPEPPELLALELKNCYISLWLIFVDARV